jgi:hypothetical protein
MKTYLFLDDFRNPGDCVNYMAFRIQDPAIYTRENWVVVRNYNEFVNYITENGLPYYISFDHDLADEHYDPSMYHVNYNDVAKSFKEKTGYDCAKWLVEYCLDNMKNLPNFIVHSMNPVGSKNISDYLNDFKSFQNFEI